MAWQDAVRRFGRPTFLISATANGLWPEVFAELRPGQCAADRPDVVARVFQRKLSRLLDVLRSDTSPLGRAVYVVHTIEYQGRGLPRAHILVRTWREG